MPTVVVVPSMITYFIFGVIFSFTNPSKTKPRGKAKSVRLVPNCGLDVIMKDPALCISSVLVPTNWKSSAEESGDLTGFVVALIIIILIQPNPELNIKKVQANKAALFQFGLRPGTHLLKK